MVQIAQCLGLRVSEIAALQWGTTFDFDKNQLLVQRSFVNGRVDDVKDRIFPGLCSFALVPDRDRSEVEHPSCAYGRRLGPLLIPRTNRPILSHRNPKAASSPLGLLCGGMSDLWGPHLVSGVTRIRKTGNGVRMLLHETRVKNSGKYGGHRLAHVPSHVSFVAGREQELR